MRSRQTSRFPAKVQRAKSGPVREAPVGARKGEAGSGAEELTTGDYIPRLTPEERARQEAAEEQTRQVRELAATDPEAMSKLLRIWLAQAR